MRRSNLKVYTRVPVNNNNDIQDQLSDAKQIGIFCATERFIKILQQTVEFKNSVQANNWLSNT